MKHIFVIIATLALISQPATSHEGHDHSSGQTQPQKGGVLKTLETIHLELVQENKAIKIYIFNKDKPPKLLEPTDYKASATVQYPRGKGSAKVELTVNNDHWLAKVDSKGLHRYDFIFTIEQGGHKDNVKFTIEPR